MSNFDIRISIKKLSNYSASLDNTEDKKTLLLMIKSFSYYISNLYLRLIEESINSRRYNGDWEPVEDKEYKNYIGTVPTTDILYVIGDALEVVKIGHNFVVRVSPKYKYPGTNIPLIRVLRAIEYGTSKFNARPLLAKNSQHINRRILDLWRGYLMMKGVI